LGGSERFRLGAEGGVPIAVKANRPASIGLCAILLPRLRALLRPLRRNATFLDPLICLPSVTGIIEIYKADPDLLKRSIDTK
jgi:hypothetical protein